MVTGVFYFQIFNQLDVIYVLQIWMFDMVCMLQWQVFNQMKCFTSAHFQSNQYILQLHTE